MGRATRGNFHLGHQPALDGLRGIAIPGIMLHHFAVLLWRDAEWWLLSGAYTSLDLFFALSGFLITCLLVAEFDRRGHIDLLDFAKRRIRRLVPAMTVVLGALSLGSLVGLGIHTPREMFTGSFWLLTFLQNWDFQNRLLGEMGQAWSLAVEGQFYILWSVAVAAVLATFRRGRTVLVVVAAAIVVAVAVIRTIRFGNENVYVLYLTTPSRIDGPLVGALAGLAYVSGWLDGLSERWAARLAGAGLAYLGYVTVWSTPFDSYQRVWPGYTINAVAGAAVVIGAVNLKQGRLAGWLRSRPLVYVGTLSYGLFLWHMPIFTYIGEHGGSWPIVVKTVLGFGATFGAAAVSYRFVESPLLRRRKLGRTVPAKPTTVVAAQSIWTEAPGSLSPAGRSPAEQGERLGTSQVTAPADVGIDGLTSADRGRLRLGWMVTAVPVLVLNWWVLTLGRWNPLQTRQLGDVFDAQARSLMSGHWDLPPEVVMFEGLLVDGQTQVYFGPLPALLRIPLFALTDHFDGRLTILSMFAAMVVLTVAAYRLSIAVRAFVRGQAPVTRGELLATPFLALAALTGVPFWMASLTIVHHEASLWGVAFTVAALDALARWILDPRLGRLGTASLLIGAALISRVSMGLGALAALGIVGLLVLVDRIQVERESRPPGAPLLPFAPQRLLAAARRSDAGSISTGTPKRSRADDTEPPSGETPSAPSTPVPEHGTGRRRRRRVPAGLPVTTPVWALLLAGLVPLAAAVVPNMARFDHPFNVPVDRHVYTLENAERQEFLGSAGGSFWHPQFVPTTLRQYLRPDAFSLRGELPWIDYPDERPKAVGNVVFDGLEWSSSVPNTMPALTVVAALGTAWLVVAFRRRRPEMWLTPLWIGALVGGSAVVTIGHVAHRYLNDLYPVVLIPAFIGFYKLLAWAPQARSERHVLLRRIATAGLAVLVGLGTWATTAMALQFQRERGPMVAEATRADWVRLRANLPFAKVPQLVPLGDPLPTKTWEGRVAVVGDCDGVYIYTDGGWQPVERGPAVGVYDLRLDVDALDGLDSGQRAPLVTLGSGEDAVVVAVARAAANLVRVDVWLGPEEGWAAGRATEMDGTVDLRVMSDRYAPPSAVQHEDELLYYGRIPRPSHDPPARIGRGPSLGGPPGVEAQYPGTVQMVPPDSSVCSALPGTSADTP